MINDKSVTFQIFGSLMKQPLLLSDTKYILTPDNFANNFEKSIFGAIYNLAMNGAKKISVVDIDNYLQNHEGIYQNFIKHNGIEYLQDCEDISTLENFDYYYNKFKKYNLLNDLKSQGFDISSIYPDEIFNTEYDSKMEQFEKMTIQDIFNKYRKRIAHLEADYQIGNDIKVISADKGIKELLTKLQASPDVGPILPGNIYNTVVRGARRGKYYIRSAGSGVGKSRSMINEACMLAYPFFYNQQNMKWEYVGSCEKVLYIGTEQEPSEIQTMILSYLTGINEEQINFGLYSKEEENIINQAIMVMEYFKDNLTISQIPDPSIQSIKAFIRQAVLENDYSCVFYDYIFNSPSLMREFKDMRLREDVILMMLSTALKDLAVELDVFIQTSTQVTINPDEKNKMKTAASIRSAKSIADKADLACVLSRVTEDDQKILEGVANKLGIMPNQVLDIYKLRSGRYNNVRIWSYFDAGCCRRKDLFITDSNNQPISNFKEIEFKIEFENSAELTKLLLKLNGYSEPDNNGEVKNKELDWSDLI
jgi:replicative DNA helicase